MCNGKLLDVLAATANFSTFYGVRRGPASGLRVVVVVGGGSLGSQGREPAHSPISPASQMLLGYANATPRGLDFLDFLDDELTYKTLFVPVNEGFLDNMVTGRGCGQSQAQCRYLRLPWADNLASPTDAEWP